MDKIEWLLVNIKTKQDRLRKVFGKIPAHVTLVPLDFDHETLASVLATHGYTAKQRTFFIWEAVTQYLTETGIRQTFDFLTQAASGSRLVFTYVRKDFIEGRVMYGQERLYKQYMADNKLWLFGMAPEQVADSIGAYGWRIIEQPTHDALTERYIKPTGRALASTPIEQIVYAARG